MANDCIPFLEEADRIPAQANGGSVAGKTFVIANHARLSGPMIPATAQVGASDPTDGARIQVGTCPANGAALGVASWDAASGEGLTVIAEGVVPVVADGAITAGDLIMVGANGKAKTYVPPALSGNAEALAVVAIVGKAVDSALDAADAQIKLLV